MVNWFLDGSNAITAAILGALTTLALQIWLKRREDSTRYAERVRDQKMSVISDLVAYRFALTDGSRHTVQDVSNFNAALSRIPVEFIGCPKILDLYYDLGTDFTAGKYYEFINELVKAADPKRQAFTLKALHSVPSLSTIPLRIDIAGMRIEKKPEDENKSNPN